MGWRALHLSAGAGAHLPPLLISASLTAEQFSVQLTDLARIWSETLDHDAIISRSKEESTSIDPSDAEQFPVFIEMLQRGLAGDKGTTLALSILSDPSRPSLVLNVSVDLPDGFAPLEWPIRLTPAPQTLFTSQLISPLLRAQHARMQETTSLVEVLKEKDHVIQKLLDKLESQGMELNQVFPQAAGKGGRKIDRKKAAERVKGLAPFEIGGWREGLATEDVHDIAQLVGDVFGADAETLNAGGAEQYTEDPEDWWESIKGITVKLDTGKISTKGASKALKKPVLQSRPVLRKHESTTSEDAFQIQATPPRSSAGKDASPPKVAQNDSTDEDDDDLDAPSQRSKIPDSYPRSPSPPRRAPSPKPARKLGRLGGKKEVPKVASAKEDDATTGGEDPVPQTKSVTRSSKKVSPPPQQDEDTENEAISAAPKAWSPTPITKAPQRKLGKIGGKKSTPTPPPPEDKLATESENEDQQILPPTKAATPPPPPPTTSTKLRAKLGRLGGKKKAPEPDSEPKPASQPPDNTTTTPTKRKIGVIGGGNKPSPAKAVKHEHASQNVEDSMEDVKEEVKEKEKEKEKTPIPETEEEKVEKRRSKLKRELEEKAKAPVKKKRKF